MVEEELIAISRREREREFKREIIAEAAYKLFTANSFETVTVQDIAKEAEFGKGTIYQYFDSKEEILAYTLEKGMDELYQQIESCSSINEDVMSALNCYLQLQYEFYLNYSHLIFSLMRNKLDGSLKPERFQEIWQKRAKKMALLEEIIARGSREGIFLAVDSKKLTRVLHNIVRGFSIESLENKGGDTEVDRDLELIKQVLSRGILNPDQEGR